MKHEVKVVSLGEVRPHPNADTLGLTTIDGYDVVVRLADWHAGDRGVYIEPDYVVPEAPWSAMLGKHRRIRVKRLRGLYSQGLLVPLADAGLALETPVGTDVMDVLGIMRYEPPVESAGADDAPAPTIAAGQPAYDLESWRKHRGVIADEELVTATEKLHGESARFVCVDGAMHVGSRVKWKRLDSNTSWAVALRCNPWIENWCRAHEGMILYGEVFGNVPKMAYGVRSGMRGFLAFDVLDPARGWLPWAEFSAVVPAHQRVPVLYEGRHDGVTAALAEGVSTLAPHVREGFVVKPQVERVVEGIGRVALKCVGNGYYDKGE